MLLLFAAFAINNNYAQIFWTENFSDQASSTTNWVHSGTNASANNLTWTWTNDPDAGAYNGPWGAAGAADGHFWFDSDGNAAGAHDVRLTNVGAPVNCTGKSDVHVRVRTFYRTFTGSDVARIGISTDGVNFNYRNIPEFDALIDEGTGGTQQWDGTLEIDVDEADNQAQVWIQFRWEGDFEYYWKVDDVQFLEPFTPQYNVTFRVNSSLVTVDPAGMFIAGSFNNWTDEALTNDGNGVWSITKTLDEGAAILYKFKNGAGGWESGNAACGLPDGFGGYNRNLTVTGDATLAAVCFNSCGPCQLTCDQNPDKIICDNFDAYSTATKLGPQASWWSTWSGTEGTTEDGIVSAEQAFTAPNSLKLVSTAATGGPQDVVLNLSNKTAGRYQLNWKMYIPAGKEGYYNIQNIVPIAAGDWNLDVFFSPAGAGNIQIGQGASLASFTYPYDTWFDVQHTIDLDNDLLTLYINGNFVKKMAYAKNLGGIDFYCTNANGQYYVDNVEYIQLPALVFNADVCGSAVDISSAMGAAPGVVNSVGPFDITTATLDPSDPTEGYDCHFGGDPLQASHWFTFTGDGLTYTINSNTCGAAPIADGDTQFALYSGECGEYVPVDCNDDISGADLRSILTFTAEAGVNYYLLVDSYNGLDGNYCLEIQQVASVSCADAVIGTNGVTNDGNICWNGNLTDVMDVDAATYVIPNQGPIAGHLWCITTEPIPAGTWPGDIPGIASTTASPDVVLVNLPNDGTAFAPGIYYLTSVIVGGSNLIDAAGQARVFNIDPTNGCYFVGESHQIFLVPELTDIVAFASVTGGATSGTIDVDLTVDGGLGGALQDPSFYNFNWSNGATSGTLTGVPAGNYSCTISDPTGCVDPFVVDVVVSANDPASVKSLTVTPNPTNGLLNLQLATQKSANVQIEVVNTIGQTVKTIQAGNTSAVQTQIDLTEYAAGVYTIRVRMDNETAVRRIVVQR